MERDEKPIYERQWFSMLTLAVALVGAFTGIVGLTITSRQSQEERQVTVRLLARANGRDYSNEGFGLRVALVNESLRGVSVVGARLYIDGHRLDVADGFLLATRVLDRQLIEPAGVTDQRRELPFSMPSRSERNIALLFSSLTDTRNNRIQRGYLANLPHRAQRLAEFAAFAGSLRPKARVTLSLDLVPGGRRLTRVLSLPGMTPRFQWQIVLDGPRKRVSSISLRRKLGAQGQSDMVQLDVWAEVGPAVHRRIRRPIVGDAFTRFPIRGLPPGRFVYVFQIYGHVIAGGRFYSPDRCALHYHPDISDEPPYFGTGRKPCGQRGFVTRGVQIADRARTRTVVDVFGMSMTNTVAVAVSALGGLLELGGLVVVIRQIASDRTQARRLLAPRSPGERPKHAYPAHIHPSSWLPPAQASVMMTSSQQVEAVRKEVRELETSVANALVRLKKTADQAQDQAIERVEREADLREQELRSAVRYVLGEGRRDRWLGVVLLGAGILFATTGSVLSSVG